jgi:hypothetical protein
MWDKPWRKDKLHDQCDVFAESDWDVDWWANREGQRQQ